MDVSVENHYETTISDSTDEISVPKVPEFRQLYIATTNAYTYEGTGYSLTNCKQSNKSPGIMEVSFGGGENKQHEGNVFTSDQPSISFSWDVRQSKLSPEICFFGKNSSNVTKYTLNEDKYGNNINQTVADNKVIGPIEYGKLLVERKDGDHYTTLFYVPVWNGIVHGGTDTEYSHNHTGSGNKLIGYGGLTISGDDYNKGTTYRIILMYQTYGVRNVLFNGLITERATLNHIEVCELTVKTRNVDGAVAIGTERVFEPYGTMGEGSFIAGDLNLHYNNSYVNCLVKCNDKIVYSYNPENDCLPDSKNVKLSLDGKVSIEIWNEYGHFTRNLYACNDYMAHYDLSNIISGSQQYSSIQGLSSFIESVSIKPPQIMDNHLQMNFKLVDSSGNKIPVPPEGITLNNGTYSISAYVGNSDCGSRISVSLAFAVEQTYNPTLNYQNMIKSLVLPNNAFEVVLPSQSTYFLHILFSDSESAYRFSLSCIGANGYAASNAAWSMVSFREEFPVNIATIDCDLISIGDSICEQSLPSDIYVYYSALDRLRLTANAIPNLSIHPIFYSDIEGILVGKELDFQLIRDENGWESDTVIVYNSEGRTLKLTYGQSVYEQLCKYGFYGQLTVKEYNVNGGISEYKLNNDSVSEKQVQDQNAETTSVSSILWEDKLLLAALALCPLIKRKYQ